MPEQPIQWRRLRCYGCAERWSHDREQAIYIEIHGRPYCIGYECSHCHMTWVGIPPDADKTRLAQAIRMVLESVVTAP